MNPNLVSLGEYVAIIRRGRNLILALLAAAFVAGLVITQLMEKTYAADSLVRLRPQGVSIENMLDGYDVDVNTASRLVRSRPVLEAVANQLIAADLADDVDLNDLEKRTATVIPTDTDLLRITVSDSSAERAAATANAFADEILELRRNDITQELSQVGAPLSTDLAALGADYAVKADELSALVAAVDASDAAQVDRAQLEIQSRQVGLETIAGQIEVLRRELATIQTVVVDPGTVSERATKPSSPSSPSLVLNLGAALALGLTLGVALAFIRERSADRIRHEGAFGEELGLAVLGSVSAAKGRFGRNPLGALYRTGTPESDAFRRVLAALHLRDGEGRVVLAVSPDTAGASSGFIANLGVVAAASGHRVHLVDTDLRRRALHEYFASPAAPGVAEVLHGRVTLESASKSWQYFGNLSVTPAGDPGEEAPQLISRKRLQSLIAGLRATNELVLLDSAPVNDYADAFVLGQLSDSVVLVVDPERTAARDLVTAVAELRRVGIEPTGVVVLESSPEYARSTLQHRVDARANA